MICVDEDAVICDLAETYHLYDYQQLSPSVVAVFCVGLPDNSRIKLKLSGLRVPIETLLTAHLVDGINTLIWMQSADCRNKAKRPKSIADAIQNPKEEKEKPIAFKDGKAFEQTRLQILRKGGYS